MLTVALLAIVGVLMLVFSQVKGAFFPAYRVFSKTVEGALCFVTSFVPFSLWDILAIPLVLGLIGTFIWCLARKRSLLKWLSTVSLIVAALLLFLVGAWGLNHYSPPLSQDLALEVREYSADELEQATAYYLEQAAALAQSVPRDDEKHLVRQDFYELAGIAGASYTPLAKQYPMFEGADQPVKALLVAGEPLIYSGHVGIFWPFTGEANVPLNVAPAEAPFTMSHEAAHRLGIASEQEANFAAFLASTANKDPRFVYSGYYTAFNYCLNALVENYPERTQNFIQQAIGETIDPSNAKTYGARLVLFDRACTNEHYQTYEGPAEDAGQAVNDTYLKVFGEESGVKSYGEVVDYLIAWQLAL
ncbi:MAG: DUF3810 domain-containing protein [Coriobacteriia bacterium]|nr:DUF3810 domain-containing protein [Coriobacteriia bacterium]